MKDVPGRVTFPEDRPRWGKRLGKLQKKERSERRLCRNDSWARARPHTRRGGKTWSSNLGFMAAIESEGDSRVEHGGLQRQEVSLTPGGYDAEDRLCYWTKGHCP